MANISFIKDVKSLKINGEPSHEYELGSDLMRVGGVRQAPRLNNVPVFRDNGYQLEFEGDNQDYVTLDSNYLMEVGESIKFDFTMESADSYPLGNYSNSEQSIRVTTSQFRITVINGQIIAFSTSNAVGERMMVEIIRTATDYEVFKNGVSLGTQSNSNQLMINALNSRNSGGGFRFDCTIHSFQLGTNEAVNFKSFNGIDVVDDSGNNVGEILTSHVDGSSYIERDIWQKKSFALAFDSSNQEYINFDSPLTINEGESISIDFTPTEPDASIIFGYMNSQSSVQYNSYLTVNQGTGRFFLSCGGNGMAVFPSGGVNIGQKYSLIIHRTGGNTYLKVDGVDTLVSANVYDVEILTIGKRVNDYCYGLTHSFRIKDKTYNLREGLGNEVNNGSNKGTIETSHVDGMRRINYGMHRKGNNIDGWTSYD